MRASGLVFFEPGLYERWKLNWLKDRDHQAWHELGLLAVGRYSRFLWSVIPEKVVLLLQTSVSTTRGLLWQREDPCCRYHNFDRRQFTGEEQGWNWPSPSICWERTAPTTEVSTPKNWSLGFVKTRTVADKTFFQTEKRCLSLCRPDERSLSRSRSMYRWGNWAEVSDELVVANAKTKKSL